MILVRRPGRSWQIFARFSGISLPRAWQPLRTCIVKISGMRRRVPLLPTTSQHPRQQPRALHRYDRAEALPCRVFLNAPITGAGVQHQTQEMSFAPRGPAVHLVGKSSGAPTRALFECAPGPSTTSPKRGRIQRHLETGRRMLSYLGSSKPHHSKASRPTEQRDQRRVPLSISVRLSTRLLCSYTASTKVSGDSVLQKVSSSADEHQDNRDAQALNPFVVDIIATLM